MRSKIKLWSGNFFAAGALAAAVTAILTAPAASQVYPNRPITVIINSAVGGPTDIIARAIKEAMEAQIGQPLIMENRPTGSGIVAADTVRRAEPDGYTILMSSSGAMMTGQIINPAAKYDPLNDFAHIVNLGDIPSAFAVNPSVPVKTLRELAAAAKAAPGKYSYGSFGFGTPSHLMGAAFKYLAGIDIVQVPFNGAPQATTALLAGDISLYTAPPTSVLQHHVVGGVRIIAFGDTQRFSQLPEVETVYEAGFPDVVVPAWFAMFAPKGVPRSVVDTLSKAAIAAMARPDVKANLDKGLYRTIAEGPEEFRARHVREYMKWKKLLADMNITMN